MLTVSNIQSAESFDELREFLMQLMQKHMAAMDHIDPECPISLFKQTKTCREAIKLTQAVDLRWEKLSRLKVL